MNELNILKDEQLLTAVDIARVLNISKALVYRLIQRGDIPSVRINHAVRVKPVALQEFIKGCQKAGQRR